jgi:branched-chain amino acid transport system ATP-binding protein
MVLAGGPDLVLLDEPTAGMAAEETSNTARVLRDLNRTGLTILVVEHDMAFVREVAQRVTVLHQGRVFADGLIDELTVRQDVRDIYLGRA